MKSKLEIRKQIHRSCGTSSYEVNSGYYLTVPNQSMSISEILDYSLTHSEVLEPIPDVPYGLDLTDIYPNVDELGVLDSREESVEESKEVENVINSNPDESTEDNNESPADSSGNQQRSKE